MAICVGGGWNCKYFKTENFLAGTINKRLLNRVKLFKRNSLQVCKDAIELKMAAGQNEGYDVERFQGPVSHDLQCVICFNVFTDPVMCQRNQHHFCRSCITRHLTNTQDCPICRDPLTMETIKPAQRMLRNWLSDLNIRCDYFHRGCVGFIKLNDLQSHIMNCGFTPTMCPNQGCDVEINQRDMAHHRSTTCESRRELNEIAQLKKDVARMTAKIGEMEATQTNQARRVAKIDVNQARILTNQTRMEGNQARMQARMERNQAKMEVNIGAVCKEVKATKTKLTELNERVMTEKNKTRCDIRNVKEDMKDQLSTKYQRIHIKNASEEATIEKSNSEKRDHHIIIVGGNDNSGNKSAEQFCWSRKSWSLLQPLKESRYAASSRIFQNQIIVAGGYETNTIEAISINPFKVSEPWSNFPAKLSQTLYLHKTVLYNYGKLITIGGYSNDRDECVDTMYEVQLVPPYQTKALAKMAQGRAMHGVEMLNDDIFIFGGTTGEYSEDCVDSIAVFNVVENSCRQISPLPYPVCDMASVLYDRNVVVLGGCGQDEALSSVVMYCTENGKCYNLPDMRCARSGCSAVMVDDDCIVVMGGVGKHGYNLKSVECFNFRSYAWEDLPLMNEARRMATAVAW